MKKIIAVLSVLLCFTFVINIPAEAYDMKYGKSFYEKVIKLECEYIESLVLPNGAVGYDVPKVNASFDPANLPAVDGVKPEEYTKWACTKIVPYFSAFAVLGIMAADYENAKDITLNYINWYISSMNTAETDVNGVAGTVYDYYVFVSPEGDKAVQVSYIDIYGDKTRNYDSTDSYASTFMQILSAYTQKYDSEFLNDKKDLLETLKNVIYSTYCKNVSLTGAKPDYMVCYLMDNCEVYAGFRDLSVLFPEYKEDAEKFLNGIKSSLYCQDGYYYPAVFENGKTAYTIDDKTSFDFYPHGTSQLFPITFGILDPKSIDAKAQYELFNSVYGQNGKAGKDWSVADCGDAYPWALNLRAAIKMGDFKRAEKFIHHVYVKYIATAHSGNYYCGEAGNMLLAVTELLEKGFNETDASLPEGSRPENSVSEAPSKKGSFKKYIPYIALGASVILGTAAVIWALNKKKKHP